MEAEDIERYLKQRSGCASRPNRYWISTSERIPSHEAYQWMVDFVDECVAPADENAAEKLSIALDGKGAFRRFKDALHRVDEHWLQAWYQWQDKRLKAAVEEWVKSVL